MFWVIFLIIVAIFFAFCVFGAFHSAKSKELPSIKIAIDRALKSGEKIAND